MSISGSARLTHWQSLCFTRRWKGVRFAHRVPITAQQFRGSEHGAFTTKETGSIPSCATKCPCSTIGACSRLRSGRLEVQILSGAPVCGRGLRDGQRRSNPLLCRFESCRPRHHCTSADGFRLLASEAGMAVSITAGSANAWTVSSEARAGGSYPPSPGVRISHGPPFARISITVNIAVS